MEKITYRLEYLKGSKEMAADFKMLGYDSRLWNVISPVVPGYEHGKGKPTFGIQGLKEKGII